MDRKRLYPVEHIITELENIGNAAADACTNSDAPAILFLIAEYIPRLASGLELFVAEELHRINNLNRDSSQ